MHTTCLAQAQLCVTQLCVTPKLAVDPSITPLSTHKLPIHRWSTLMEKTPTLPHIPDTKLTVTSKVQFLQLRHVFHQKCKSSIPHVWQHTLPSQHLIRTIRLNTNKPNSMSLAAPKANHIPCCNKNLIHKNTFRPSPSYFIFILPLFTLKP